MEIWACVGVLCPFPCHLFLWAFPQIWVDLCGRQRDPCLILALVSLFLKSIQYATLFSVATFSWPPPPVFWPFFIFGLVCNFRTVSDESLIASCKCETYQRLGVSGMYYGERFGKSIPWSTEAPASQLTNVRYGGSMMYLVALLTWCESPYSVVWIVGMICVCKVEAEEDPSTRAKPVSS